MADENDKPKTTKQVVKYLAEHGIKTELCRGKGYLYFWGDKEAGWFSSSVAVPRVSDLTFGRWLKEYRSLEGDYRNH
jgi:hypothetical protein